MGCLYYGWPVLAHLYADSFVSSLSTKVAEWVSCSVPTALLVCLCLSGLPALKPSTELVVLVVLRTGTTTQARLAATSSQ